VVREPVEDFGRGQPVAFELLSEVFGDAIHRTSLIRMDVECFRLVVILQARTITFLFKIKALAAATGAC
jgi:hypothetical protein